MKSKVTFGSPRRASVPVKEIDADHAGNDPKNLRDKSRCMYPSIEGVLHTPLFSPAAEKGKEKVTVNELVALASTLSLPDQKLLLAKLALLAQTGHGEDSRDIAMWTEAVYTAMVALIGVGGEGMPAPLPLKRVLSATTSWGAVRDFMMTSKLAALSVTKRQSAYLMLAQLLVDHANTLARKSGIALSGKLVANCASNLASVFDQAYPGYVRAGYARLVAARFASGLNSG